jgi:type I restriction enzyme S subunit
LEYLDERCSAMDTLISKKQQFLDELENYKKSLIYEYVTGKREVEQ